MNKNIVPYAEISGEIYDFGIRRITAEEQFNLFTEAEQYLTEEKYDMRRQEQYKYFERQGFNGKTMINMDRKKEFTTTRPYGYCKSSNCKMHAEKAAFYGKEVAYHCKSCLSDIIVNQRKHSKGASLSIEFAGEGGENKNKDPIMIEFSSITGKNPGEVVPVIYIVDIKGNRLWCLKYTWISEKPKPCLRVSGIDYETREIIDDYDGKYDAIIRGRLVCENIIFGNKCQSLQPDYIPNTFHMKSVPPGTPGWKEIHSETDIGKISICRFCPACAAKFHKDNSSTQPYIVDNVWQQEYIKLQQEYVKLQQENVKLRDDMNKLKSDNWNLKNENANLRTIKNAM